MLKWFARRALRRFSRRYGYDTGYMEEMLEHAPMAFTKFALVQGAAAHRKVVPVDAYFAAKLVASAGADCGPCTQLCSDMAAEAGMPERQIEAVLGADREAMNPATLLGFDFARALELSEHEQAAARRMVREQWGTAGVVELAMGHTMAQVFPRLKTALGHGASCRVVQVGQRPVVVARGA